jgi:DNA mismatch repair protein MutL
MGTHRAGRTLLFTFLNRRPVESSVFLYALRGAYAEALPRGQWPVAFLFLEIDPCEVDVNVHPSKREVRFRDGIAVQSALMEILGAVLRCGRTGRTTGMAAAPEAPPPPPALGQSAAAPPTARWQPSPQQRALLPVAVPGASAPRTSPTSQTSPTSPTVQTARTGSTPAASPPGLEAATASATAAHSRDAFAAPPPVPYRVLSPLGDQYWLLQGDEGLVILDHRAAWERILFEEARTRAAAGGVASQQLLSPLTVSLSPREYDFLRPHLETLRLMGVGAGEFGANTIVIDSLPPFYSGDGDAHALISALIADLQHAGDRAPQRRLDHEAIAAAVARHAAQLQPPADTTSVAQLTDRLLACDMPYCCPEGRPTLIQISFQELARKFGKR